LSPSSQWGGGDGGAIIASTAERQRFIVFVHEQRLDDDGAQELHLAAAGGNLFDAEAACGDAKELGERIR